VVSFRFDEFDAIFDATADGVVMRRGNTVTLSRRRSGSGPPPDTGRLRRGRPRALEIKATRHVTSRDLRGLEAIAEELWSDRLLS
jgi:hypothetical protein